MREHQQNEVVYDKVKREEILRAMERVTAAFYPQSTQTHCHPFIEFTGLMNEYIKVCRAAHEEGIDFTQANTHTGQSLPMATFNVTYLAEKLNCIYGPSLIQDGPNRDAFIDVLFDGKFKLVPR